MANATVERYVRRFIPSPANNTLVEEYRKQLRKDTRGVRLIKSPTVGDIALFQWEKYPQHIMEIVIATNGEDCVTTLYEYDSIFANIAEYEEVRWKLITEIAGLYSALPSAIRFTDGRDRQIEMKEMGTAQLIDNLAHLTYTSI